MSGSISGINFQSSIYLLGTFYCCLVFLHAHHTTHLQLQSIHITIFHSCMQVSGSGHESEFYQYTKCSQISLILPKAVCRMYKQSTLTKTTISQQCQKGPYIPCDNKLCTNYERQPDCWDSPTHGLIKLQTSQLTVVAEHYYMLQQTGLLSTLKNVNTL